MKLRIDAYQTSSGRRPAYKFIEEQSGEAISRILAEIDHLEKHGLDFMIDNGSVKPIRSTKPPFYELKIKADSSFYRFPFIVIDSVVYLLDGFKKQTNKLEQKDIDRAVKRAKEILR